MFPRRKNRKLVPLSTLVMTSLATFGCSVNHFGGGREVDVTLASNCQGEAYLISGDTYNADPAIAQEPKRLSDPNHNYDQGPVPATVRVIPRDYEFVVMRTVDGKLSKPVLFRPEELGDDQTVHSDFDDVPR
jgi:hypothetical protein